MNNQERARMSPSDTNKRLGRSLSLSVDRGRVCRVEYSKHNVPTKTFKWDVGLKAMTVILCRTVAWWREASENKRRKLEEWQRSDAAMNNEIPPLGLVCVASSEKSLASSLRESLIRDHAKLLWPNKIFGPHEQPEAFFGWNTSGGMSAGGRQMTVWLDVTQLSPQDVIFLDSHDEQLSTAAMLELADQIESTHERRKGKGFWHRAEFFDPSETQRPVSRIAMLADHYPGDLFADAVFRGFAGAIHGRDIGKARGEVRLHYQATGVPFTELLDTALQDNPAALVVGVGGAGDVAGDLRPLVESGMPVVVYGASADEGDADGYDTITQAEDQIFDSLWQAMVSDGYAPGNQAGAPAKLGRNGVMLLLEPDPQDEQLPVAQALIRRRRRLRTAVRKSVHFETLACPIRNLWNDGTGLVRPRTIAETTRRVMERIKHTGLPPVKAILSLWAVHTEGVLRALETGEVPNVAVYTADFTQTMLDSVADPAGAVQAIAGVDPYIMGEVMARMIRRRLEPRSSTERPTVRHRVLAPVLLRKPKATSENIINSWELLRAFPQLSEEL